MRKIVLLLFILQLANPFLSAQNPALQVKKYVLDNGFTVFLNEDKTAGNVYGAVVVKAGGKNDPADATGMAHYLEHLLFKGTTELGTLDYLKEKPHLDSIVMYYDSLGNTKDENERRRIQLLINRQSVEAAKYALPTEFDKLVKSIGGTGLNAFTSADMTVYHNAFPGEQLDKWIEIYSHRFQNPVFRSFQSELEVVYEEKNMGMDNFQRKMFEEMCSNLFRNQPYGTQTTSGSVEHLKNPSLRKMYEYFNTYYVANNMALVLSGNFDSEKYFPLIKEKFGKLRTGTVPKFPDYPATGFKGREHKQVRMTPIKVSLIGYKTFAAAHKDKAAMDVALKLLFNGSETGKLNKLQREGKVLFAAGFDMTFNNDGAVIFFVVPKIVGQSIKKAEKLLFTEINKIKRGEISDRELEIIKKETFVNFQTQLEDHRSRALLMVSAFSEGVNWEDVVNYSHEIDRITKADVLRVANTYFGDNYFALHSRTGFPKKQTIAKPGFKPVTTPQKEESAYAKKFNSTISTASNPKFLDFEKDATLLTINESNKLYVVKNPTNDIFRIDVKFRVGTETLKKLDLSSQLFSYFRPKDWTLDSFKEEFALLGLSYYASCDQDLFSISFYGLESNFEASLKLINKLIYDTYPEEKALKNVINDVRASRKFEGKEPSTGGRALYEYALFGNKSSYLDRISVKEMNNVKADELLKEYRNAVTYDAAWHYSGTRSAGQVLDLIRASITPANNSKSQPVTIKTPNSFSTNTIYVVHDKKAVQSQAYFRVNSDAYRFEPKLSATVSAFNQYMGGSFSGLIMQEIREFRSLAYGAGGSFSKPAVSGGPSAFVSFLSCQADKTNEAVKVMRSLIDSMPEKPERMDPIRLLLKNSTSAAYPGFRELSKVIESARMRGYNFYPLKAEYEKYDSLKYEDIVAFYKTWIQSRPVVMTIYGNTSKMDLVELAKYGKVIELKRSQIFKD